MPILQTGADDIETMKKSYDPDTEISSRPIKWNVEYSNSIRVNVGVPKDVRITSKTTNTLEEETLFVVYLQQVEYFGKDLLLLHFYTTFK